MTAMYAGEVWEVWCLNAYLPEVPAPFAEVERCGNTTTIWTDTADPVLSGYYCEPCLAIVNDYIAAQQPPVTDTAP
jgi:hypothetical protein